MPYYGAWRKDSYSCSQCGWQGRGAELEIGECYNGFGGLDCPKCRTELSTILFPTTEEIRANWDVASEDDRLMCEAVEATRERFERLKLRDPAQLSEIQDESFFLIWDEEHGAPGSGNQTIIRHCNRCLWREPAGFENPWRFREVAGVLRERYGTRVTDLVPTARSLVDLYGDRHGSRTEVRDARRTLFPGASGEPEYLDAQSIEPGSV